MVETEPGLKSATASSVTKPAKTETGLVVQVPPFINEGEKIRVDTAEGAYLSRSVKIVCHPERSGKFASRTVREVEGPLQVAMHADGSRVVRTPS